MKRLNFFRGKVGYFGAYSMEPKDGYLVVLRGGPPCLDGQTHKTDVLGKEYQHPLYDGTSTWYYVYRYIGSWFVDPKGGVVIGKYAGRYRIKESWLAEIRRGGSLHRSAEL